MDIQARSMTAMSDPDVLEESVLRKTLEVLTPMKLPWVRCVQYALDQMPVSIDSEGRQYYRVETDDVHAQNIEDALRGYEIRIRDRGPGKMAPELWFQEFSLIGKVADQWQRLRASLAR